MKSSRKKRKNGSRGSFRLAALLAGAAGCLCIALILCLSIGVRREKTPPDGAGDVADASVPAATEEPAMEAAAVLPIPTEQPAPAYAFIEEADAPLPQEGARLPRGENYALDGTVTCDAPLLNVTVMLICDYTEDPFYPYTAQVTFSPDAEVKRYRLTDAASTLEGVSIADQLDFTKLGAGVHTLVVSAVCAQADSRPQAPFTYAAGPFYVLGADWSRVRASQFSNGSYATALEFFGGDTERFLYRYQSVYGRYTVADPDWEKQYITEIQVDAGEPWRVHVDAVPFYERVRGYLASASVRVHGTNGDTGVLPLSRLIVDYNGSFVSRFTSAKKKNFSHHGLGTATDVNAVMPPNMNTPENRALIDNEVRDYLAYNGILNENGVQYYDFTYSGGYAATDFGVPESVINFLLYELAFYRAGFAWGHYYNSTSDGMHFVLTDNIKRDHGGAQGLRKVYEYYD